MLVLCAKRRSLVPVANSAVNGSRKVKLKPLVIVRSRLKIAIAVRGGCSLKSPLPSELY